MNILSCNETLGTCCSEYEISSFIIIIKQAIDVLQILVPITLIAMAMFQMSKMMMFPDDKKLLKSLINKFIAAVIVFLLPAVLTVTINAINAGTGKDNFDINKCIAASEKNAKNIFIGGSYIQTGGKAQLIIKNTKYELGTPPKDDDSGSGSGSGSDSGSGSAGRGSTDVVKYAKSFVGNRYCWGGNDPHSCADCSGFVVYVLNHFSKSGHKISRASLPGWTSNYGSNFVRVSANNIKPGDIVHYPGHYAMLTGNGKEIVHASNVQTGIKTSPTYAYRNIEGIYR